LLAVAVVALAADAITGKWVYEQAGRDGGTPRPVTFELKAEGAKLTGTVSGAMGGRGGGGGGAPQAQPISNGKVDGNNVSFDVTREGQQGSMTTKYVGVVAGNEMKLKVTRPGRGGGDPTTVDVVAKKQ
jgi:hypothetical protein